MLVGLDTLKDLPGKRKIAVLGDMKEIGRFSIEAHKDLGRTAKDIVDVLVTVGPEAKYIAEGATAAGMPKKNIHTFGTADVASSSVQEFIKKGDTVLVKASRSVRLDKVVEKIKAF